MNKVDKASAEIGKSLDRLLRRIRRKYRLTEVQATLALKMQTDWC